MNIPEWSFVAIGNKLSTDIENAHNAEISTTETNLVAETNIVSETNIVVVDNNVIVAHNTSFFYHLLSMIYNFFTDEEYFYAFL